MYPFSSTEAAVLFYIFGFVHVSEALMWSTIVAAKHALRLIQRRQKRAITNKQRSNSVNNADIDLLDRTRRIDRSKSITSLALCVLCASVMCIISVRSSHDASVIGALVVAAAFVLATIIDALASLTPLLAGIEAFVKAMAYLIEGLMVYSLLRHDTDASLVDRVATDAIVGSAMLCAALLLVEASWPRWEMASVMRCTVQALHGAIFVQLATIVLLCGIRGTGTTTGGGSSRHRVPSLALLCVLLSSDVLSSMFMVVACHLVTSSFVLSAFKRNKLQPTLPRAIGQVLNL